jgi:hypothetical protein
MDNFSWDSLSWTFTFPDYPREWLASDFYAWSGFNDLTSGSNQTFFTFRIENLTVANDTSLDLLCPAQQACGPTFDWGVLTFSPVATPEPGTLGMVALGIALVLCALRAFLLTPRSKVPAVQHRSPNQDAAASMPDVAWPIGKLPPC